MSTKEPKKRPLSVATKIAPQQHPAEGFTIEDKVISSANNAILSQASGLYSFLASIGLTQLLKATQKPKLEKRVLRLPSDTSFSFSNSIQVSFPKYLLEKEENCETFCKRVLELGYNAISFCSQNNQEPSSLTHILKERIQYICEFGIECYIEISPVKTSDTSFYSKLSTRLEYVKSLFPEPTKFCWHASFTNFHFFSPQENRAYTLLDKMKKECLILKTHFNKLDYHLPSFESLPTDIEGWFIDFLSCLPEGFSFSYYLEASNVRALYKDLLKTPLPFQAPLTPIYQAYSKDFGKGLWPELNLKKMQHYFDTINSVHHSKSIIDSPDIPFSEGLFSLNLRLFTAWQWTQIPLDTLASSWLEAFTSDKHINQELLQEVATLSASLEEIDSNSQPKLLAQTLLNRSKLLEKSCHLSSEDSDSIKSQLKYFLRDLRKLTLYKLQQHNIILPQALSGDDLKNSFFAHLETPAGQGIGRSMEVELLQSSSEISFDQTMEKIYKEARTIND
ncbi:MAG: hypothetical protein GWP59_01610 [Chlamydiales bacterium]|nr:hypothetical protein [Chlamydiales bacterium]NCF70376.1 hypothetical protein [Chlamydiales bacterium]